jgi:Asp-tRNA(Asn)/Glu-tRNA(Gln) amidotransferase A subunit family amidase
MPSDLYFKPAYELAAMIRRRELKPSELMAATIERIEQTNPKLNAFVALRTDAAMAEARALDEKIAKGEEIGPLAGLPLGVKDLEDAAGLATTYGSVPFKNHIAKKDSVQVARLKAAGAIVIGKTNAPEFGYTAQSVEPRAHAGWIIRWKLGGDRGRRGAARDWLRWRRLDSHPRMLRRMLRAQAIVRAHPQ